MKLTTSLALGAACLAAAAAVHAVPLVPGSTSALPGTSLAASPWLDGFVVESRISDFVFGSGSGLTGGTVEATVVKAFDGSFDFQWRITNDFFSADSIAALRLGGFAAGSFIADWLQDSPGDIAPSGAHLYASATNVDFYFGGADKLSDGRSSFTFFLDTDARGYGLTAFYDLLGAGGDASGLFATFAPSAVPEPESAALMLAGLAGLWLTRRRQAPA